MSQTPPEMIYSPKEEVSSRRRREFHFCSYPYLPASQCLALKFLPASPDYLPSSHRKRTVEADYPNPLSNFSSLFAPLAEKINPPSCLFYPTEEEEEEEEYHVGSIQLAAFNASGVAERRDVRDGSQPLVLVFPSQETNFAPLPCFNCLNSASCKQRLAVSNSAKAAAVFALPASRVP